jgi:nucleoid DNA-binding protein
MFQYMPLPPHWALWLAQVPVAPAQTVAPATAPATTSVLISGSQFFIALIAGLLLAFAIQLLLTNFSVAAGISYLGHSSDSDSYESSDSSSPRKTMKKIGFGVGLWTLISVSVALFFACYLAVQLSLLNSARIGAILGLVVWAAYFSLLVWVSSNTVSSLIGSMMSMASSGFQTLFGAATAAIGGQVAKKQVVSTAEAVASAVRHELGSAIDPVSIRESVEEYVQALKLPKLDLSKISKDFEGLLNDPEIAALAEGDNLRHIDRQTFVDLVSKRTDFSKGEVNRLAGLLEGIWQQTLGKRSKRDSLSELSDYLRSAQPGQLELRELNAKVDRLLAERSQSVSSAPESQGGLTQTVQSGLTTLTGLVLGRTDLSDLDVEQVLAKLKGASGKVGDQASKAIAQLPGTPDSQAYSPIRADVEHYLLNKYSWQMNKATLDREFRDLLYDPKADPGAVAQQISQLNRDLFVELLSSRGVFTQSKIQEIADQLEAIRRDVFSGAIVAKEIEIEAELKQRIETYLTLTPKDQLRSTDTLPAFKAIIEDTDISYDALGKRLSIYNRDQLRQILSQRQDMIAEEREEVLTALEKTRDRVLFDAKSIDEQAQQKLTEAQQKVESYLRNTNKAELNPEGIKRDLQLLLSDPQLGLSALRNRASKIDRDTLVQLLSQRQDMTEADAVQVLDQVESSWKTVVHSPSALVETVKDKSDQSLNALADYLRRTNLEELNPEGIQRDLKTLLDDPKEGAFALRRRLSKIDRETLVRLLSQREDLSAAQVNRAIDQVQESIRQLLRSPRRLAMRTQQTVVDFESSVEEYLRNTDKDELNPEGIKRDLGMLIQSPKQGVQSLGDRLSRFDRSTLIALLSQRKDMTPEEADRVVSQIESVRDQAMQQMQQVQRRIQDVVDRLFGQIRDYLNSLDRPELNYDGIKRDVRTLFDDPQAGFDALRGRLGQFDRGTLVAILSSREDISEEDANRVIDQIESARNSVLQRAERIQLEAQRRLEDVKLQAQRQVEETRKAAAAAAWWLFVTAVVSAAAAAGAGALGAS